MIHYNNSSASITINFISGNNSTVLNIANSVAIWQRFLTLQYLLKRYTKLYLYLRGFPNKQYMILVKIANYLPSLSYQFSRSTKTHVLEIKMKVPFKQNS